MTFSTLHIAVTALGVGAVAFVLGSLGRVPTTSAVVSAATSAGGTMGWRLAANVAGLNDDGLPWVSANDVLAAAVVYLLLGMYADLAPPADRLRFDRMRIAITVATLVVNVIAI